MLTSAKIRADVVADKLAALGFAGSERTVRRAVAGSRPVIGPVAGGCVGRGIVEPGMWAQWDRGQRPRIAGRSTNLFVPGWRNDAGATTTFDRMLSMPDLGDRSVAV